MRLQWEGKDMNASEYLKIEEVESLTEDFGQTWALQFVATHAQTTLMNGPPIRLEIRYQTEPGLCIFICSFHGSAQLLALST